ncbi:MAG: HrgA protein [Alphaproteobacteria bacterium]|nr:HrgA protein [Alphaproteobacteria bacterium]
MSLKINEKTHECLKHNPEQRFTARQIAEWIFDKYPEECKEKLQNSTTLISEQGVIQQIISEIGSKYKYIQKSYPNIKITAERPRHYYYSDASDEKEVENNRYPANNTALTEEDLYPKLATYLYSNYQLFSKRINEKTSRNNQGRGGNKWLHPDIVAIELLDANWDESVKNLYHSYGDKPTKIWAFEIKIIINQSNVRESFFQAVSNSSWANLGYLVAAEINANAIAELNLLANLHGIGVILLNVETETESEIIIPAKEKEMDWNTINRIAEQNPDFKKLIDITEKLINEPDPEIYPAIIEKAKFYSLPTTDDD